MPHANIWVGDSRASEHCINDRHGGSNICKGSGADTIVAHGETMTASNIIDIAGIWCINFGKEQLKATLKDVKYNPKSIFYLFSIRETIKEGRKLSGKEECLLLMKGNAKIVFGINIMTKNCVIFVHTCGENTKLLT